MNPLIPTTGRPTPPRLGLSRAEAAEVLSVSVRTIDNLIADPSTRFPFRRIGRKIVIPWRALELWLDEQVVDQYEAVSGAEISAGRSSANTSEGGGG